MNGILSSYFFCRYGMNAFLLDLCHSFVFSHVVCYLFFDIVAQLTNSSRIGRSYYLHFFVYWPLPLCRQNSHYSKCCKDIYSNVAYHSQFVTTIRIFKTNIFLSLCYDCEIKLLWIYLLLNCVSLLFK